MGLRNPLQIPIRGDADKEFVVDLFVDLKLGVGLEVLMNSGLGVVAGAPGAVGEHVGREVFDDGVEDDAVAVGGDQGGVGLKFG